VCGSSEGPWPIHSGLTGYAWTSCISAFRNGVSGGAGMTLCMTADKCPVQAVQLRALAFTGRGDRSRTATGEVPDRF